MYVCARACGPISSQHDALCRARYYSCSARGVMAETLYIARRTLVRSVRPLPSSSRPPGPASALQERSRLIYSNEFAPPAERNPAAYALGLAFTLHDRRRRARKPTSGSSMRLWSEKSAAECVFLRTFAYAKRICIMCMHVNIGSMPCIKGKGME